MAYSTAWRLRTGRLPGKPRQTGHTRLLGAAPKVVPHPQNTLDCVASSAWISRPMTISYSIAVLTDIDGHLPASPPMASRSLGPGQLLVRVRGPQHQILAERRTDDLQSYGQSLLVHA